MTRQSGKAHGSLGPDSPATLPLGQTTDEQFMAMVDQQRAMFVRLADAVAAGEELSRLDRKVVAAALKLAASNLPDSPPRSRGSAHRARFPHGDAVLEYYAMIRNPTRPIKKTPAVEALAEKYGVSIEAIKDAIKKHGPAAEALFE